MNLRKIIRNTLKEAYNSNVVQYSAVVIEDSTEEQKIKGLAKEYIPEGWSEPAHYHMTISQGPIPESLKLRGDLNKEVDLTINMIGTSDLAVAFGTFGYYSKNEMPHITIAFNQSGGSAGASKEIKNWTPIDKIIVKGVIREIGEGNKILREDINDNVKIDLVSQKIFLNGKQIGVLEIATRNNKYIILDKIFIDKDYQGRGYATEAMKQLIDYANKNNIIITLTPDSVWGSNKNKLIKWYKSFGFIMNKGKNKDFQTMQLMYKLPSQLEEMIGFKQFATTASQSAHPGIPAEFPNPNDYDQFGNKINDIAI